MSNFPEWWDSTITVFNKFTDPTTRIVTWTKTVLTDCFWKEVGSKSMIGNTIIDTYSLVCRIPKNENFVISGNWMQLTPDERQSKFTLSQGDIIIFDNCPDDIDEYKSGSRSSDILAKYHKLNSCMEIKTTSYNTMTGMINPHYCVRGL